MKPIFILIKKEIHTTALLKWFLADFGGIKGIKNIFKTQLSKGISDYKVKYKEYSWEEDLVICSGTLALYISTPLVETIL